MLSEIFKKFVWNALMAAAVFLPSFLILNYIMALFLVGPPRVTPLQTEIGDAITIYLLFLLPLVLASFVYTLVSMLVPASWPVTRRRLAAVLLAPLLPVTVFVLNLPGGFVYIAPHMLRPIGTVVFYLPTVIAVILYGMFTHVSEVKNKSS